MKTKFLKVFSLVLAVSLLVIAAGLISGALGNYSLKADSVSVELTGEATEATVSIYSDSQMSLYGFEGYWSITEDSSAQYFTLKSISSEVDDITFNGYNFADVETGQVIWVDDEGIDSATPTNIAAGSKFLTATYDVADDTPEGTYTVSFTFHVFADETLVPDETETTFNATIKVTHEKGYVDNGDGTHDYVCDVCGVEKDNEAHTYEDGKCVCGAEEPAVVTGLKGDVDLDEDVDVDDLTYLAEHVAKIITITNEKSLANAEVTGDGEVSIDDLTKLAEYVAKIIPSLD